MKHYLKENLTIPNLLSFIRILLVVPLIQFLMIQNYILAGIVLLISAVSDALDGLIARKFNQISQLGKILDPIADKLTLIAVVICINILYPDISIFVMLLFLKEILMLSGGAVLLNFRIRPPAAKWYGKVSTAVFYASIITLVVLKAVWGYTNSILTTTLLTITTLLMLFSLTMYSILFVKLVKQKNAENKAAKKAHEAEPDVPEKEKKEA